MSESCWFCTKVDDLMKRMNSVFRFCHPNEEMVRFFKAGQNQIESVFTIMVEFNRFCGSS